MLKILKEKPPQMFSHALGMVGLLSTMRLARVISSLSDLILQCQTSKQLKGGHIDSAEWLLLCNEPV